MKTREEKALELFNALSRTAIEEIQVWIEDGRIGTKLGQATKYKAVNFEYKKGLFPSISMQLSREAYLEEVWDDGAFEFKKWLIDYMDNSGIMASLNELYPERANARDVILNFIRCYIFECFQGKVANQDLIEKNIAICINDLEERPVRYRMTLWIDGTTIDGKERLHINNVLFTLRRPEAKDFEEGHPDNPMEQLMSSMVLEVEGCFINDSELQNILNFSITILRLFNVGGVRSNVEKRISESMINRGVSWLKSIRAGEISNERYLISEEDFQALREFWDVCTNKLPMCLYDMSIPATNNKSIAYRRYCDSLLMKNSEEARIASIVMGLEALYLEGGQELSFRLRTRAGKLLGLLPGFDAKTIVNEIKDAYVVRSKYVHGALLREDDKKKLVERNGDMKYFISRLSNYLRISIILFCFIDKEKGFLLQLIDESLIDEKANRELGELKETLPNIPLQQKTKVGQ
jgi:hypothetical protein